MLTLTCFVVNTFYDPSLTGISSEHFRGKLIFLKKNVWEKNFEELNWIVKHCQYFECGLLASSPSCFFQCNLIQFDVGRDLNLNIIAKKRQGWHRGKTCHIHLSPSTSHLCCDLTDKVRFKLGSNICCWHTLSLAVRK